MDLTRLATALRSRCDYQIVEATPSPRQLRLLGRLPNARMPDMLLLVHHLSRVAAQKPGWTADISKWYFEREGRVRFAWRIIFQADNIEAHLGGIAAAVAAAPRSNRIEVDQAPLIGASAIRTAPIVKGKRAVGLSGTVLTGKNAL